MPTSKRRRKNSVAVQYAVPRRGLPRAPSLRRWALAARPDMSITLRIVGAAEARRLNSRYRGKNYPTNVLSFPLDGAGDIVLCHPVLVREAREQGKALASHYAHLVVHGVLHLRGLRHGKAMERREVQILRGLGVADPYMLDR
ncbi:MAG TPA: rRNA maturation RNase YbeY [Burkholderiales bacterium]|nr:rRNA maturation RNase YbeY [Burkholderiales bacterium]